MSNVPTTNNIILNNQIIKNLYFGPIPLPQSEFDMPYVTVTYEPQTVDMTQIVDVDMKSNAESVTPVKNISVETTQIPSQTSAQTSAQKSA